MNREALLPRALVLAAGIAMLVIAYQGFRAFPHSADEYVYLYQARTFLEGRLSNPPLPDPAFQFTHTIATDAGTRSKYPPGWPALLALATQLGLPFALNPVLSMLTLLLAYRLAREIDGRHTALVALTVLATSPFFLMNGAALYSHPLGALATLGIGFCLWRYSRALELPWLLGASAALGVLALTRLFDASLVALAVSPFAAIHLIRQPRTALLHALAGIGVLLAFVGIGVAYNAALTGDPWLLGHLRYLPEDQPKLVSFRYFTPTLRRMREYALFGYPVLGIPLALFVLRRDLAKGVLAFAALLIGCLWIGFASYPVDPPPRLGPRYLYAAHAFTALLLAAGLRRAVRRQWLLPVVSVLAAAQLFHTVVLTVEVNGTIRQGASVYRAAQALEQAIAPEEALVILAGPSGTIPEQDLTRNDFDFEAPVLFVRQRIRGDAHWERSRFRDRRIYYWDGIGGPPLLWTADPDAPVQQVMAGADRSFRVKRGTASGWLAAFGTSDCAPVPYLSLMWRGLFPPDRLSDVQRPAHGDFGPCPGFSTVRQLETATIPGDLPRRMGITSHLRSFLSIETSGDYRFLLRGNERAVLRVGGVVVAESAAQAPARASLHLDPGTYPISLAHFTLWTEPSLDLAIQSEAGDRDTWQLTMQAPEGTRFHPRLPESAFGKF